MCLFPWHIWELWGAGSRLVVRIRCIQFLVGASLLEVTSLTLFSEVVHQLKNTEAKILLTHPSLAKTALAAANQVGLSRNQIFLFSDSEIASHEGIQDWRCLLGDPLEGTSYIWPKLSPEESHTTVATINYSSGTTGLPKGVCVSHHNLIANIVQTVCMFYPDKNNPPRERWIGFLPLYHAYGQLWTILIAVKLNTPVYIMKQFLYEDFLLTIQERKITNLHLVPPILVMLSKRPETAKYDISSVKKALCGAAPLSKELQNEISRRFGMQINQGTFDMPPMPGFGSKSNRHTLTQRQVGA